MGLDLHPARAIPGGDWVYADLLDAPSPQWSYVGFSEFRARLAATEGFALADMRGFDGDREWDSVDTPLKPLLNHSDCDGEMTPAECAEVLPRLTEIIAGWAAASDPADFGLDYDVRAGRELCRALEMCASENLTLLFR